jgi:predicted membrane protein
MKMGSSLFWGIILIIIGLSLVVKVVFNIDFPIFKIVVAFIFIYIGLKIMLGGNFRSFHDQYRTKNDVVFGESRFNKADHGTEYNVIFSKGNFDFRDIELKPEGPTIVHINTVFGGSQVIIRRDMPVRIKIDAAFAGAHLPNGNNASFGSTIYSSDSLDTSKPYLEIDADIVFGGLQVISY